MEKVKAAFQPSTSNVVVTTNVGSNVQIAATATATTTTTATATATTTTTAKPTVAVEELTALVQATSLEEWVPTTPPYGDDDWHE